MKRNPLRDILDIKKSELPLALLMFTYFLLVITSFWILKPIKKSLFIQFYDEGGFQLFLWHLSASQAELIAKVLNMVVAFAAMIIFTVLVRWFRRQQLTFIFTGFFLASYVAYTFVIDNPGDLTVWSFYLFGDLFSTVMVASFFAFLNDSVSPDESKRLYGLVGLGGVSGGVLGTTVVSTLIASVSVAAWLWICFGLGIVIFLVAFAAGRLVEDRVSRGEAMQEDLPERKPEGRVSPFVEGFQVVFRSKYFLSIAGIVGFYEIVSTMMDYQFTSTVAHYLDDPEIGKQFSTVFAITNSVSLFVQLFLTSFIMTRFGVGVALLVLPIAALAGSTLYMALPVLWVGSLLNTVDNGFSYSINQSAKEALYVPTSVGEKYRAKAFVDMFVQRFAKAVAVFLTLAITMAFEDFSQIRWLSMLTVLVVAVWILAVRYGGKRFQEILTLRESISAGH